MKNTLRKFISFALVVMMLCGSFSPAFAADTQPKVMLNGEYVEFSDAAPKNVDGRVMVPVAPILEALGATVNWNQQTKVVTATKDDETITFQIGQPDVVIKNAEGEKTVKMDVVPFVDGNRTYVGTRFMAEAFGYTVGWDHPNKTAVIIDYDKIFGSLEDDFSIMNRLNASDQMDLNKTYETTMDLQMTLAIAGALLGGDQNMNLQAAADIDAVQKGMDVDMSMNLHLDFDQLVNTISADLTAEEKAEMTAQLESFKNIEMKIKMDGDSGDTYIQCPLLDSLFVSDSAGDSASGNTWYKMNIYEVYEQMGIDLKELMDLSTDLSSGKVDMQDMIKTVIESTSESITVDTYGLINGVYAVVKSIFGDEAFTTTNANGVTTYTSEFSGVTIADAFSKANGNSILSSSSSSSGASLAELQEMMNLLKGINGKLAMSEKDGVLQNSDFVINCDVEGIKIGLDVKGNSETGTMSMTFDIPEVGKFDLTMKITSKESTKTVDVKIPENAQVIDLMENSVLMSAS